MRKVVLGSVQARIAVMLVALIVAVRAAPVARSLALPNILRDLMLSRTEIGFFLATTVLTTCIVQLPAGLLADRFGIRRMASIALFILALSLASGCLFQSIMGQLVFSVGAGIALAFAMPVLLKAISEWYPVRLRGRILCGLLLIAPALTPLIGFVVQFWSWQGLFLIMSLFALLASVGCYVFLSSRRNVTLTPEQELVIDSGALADETTCGVFRGFFRILGSSATWGLFVAGLAIGLLTQSQWGWVEQWLAQETTFDTGSLATAITLIIAICSFAGLILGGISADWVQRRSNPLGDRRTLLFSGLAGSALLWVMAPFAPSIILFTMIAGAAMFFAGIAQISLWVLAMTMTPARYGGTFTAIQAFSITLGGFCNTIMLALLADVASDSLFLSGQMTIAAIFVLGAALLQFWLVRKPILGTQTRGLEAVF